MTTLQAVELGVLGPLRVRQDGAPVAIPGAKPRAVLTMLGLHHGSVVAADTLVELLWGEDPPRTAAKALQTHISALRRALGDGFVLTQGTGWSLAESEVDASRYKSAVRRGRDAAATGDISQAVARFEEALALWRGIPELPDGRRGTSEKTRWIEGHAALVEDRADALLATARAAEIIGELEAAVAEAPLRERRWGQLMLALYRAGRQGDALGAYQRARTLLADELGIDPGPELRRLEAAIVAQDATLDVVVAQQHPSVMRAVTFLLTDIEGSTAAWEADAAAMAVALARHDELAEQVVTSRGGRLIKTRGEGDATFSVFDRPSAAAAAAMELQDAISHEPWGLREPMRIRIALHTGEVELRDGDYFGRAVNRAARLRSLAVGGQILCSGATAELVVDSLPDDVVLADLGLRELRNLARPEHVFELRQETAEEVAEPPTSDAPPMERPGIPAVLIGTGPFVGRGSELEKLLSAWQTSLGSGACAALIAGEPGVGKTRLAGEWSRQAYEQGAVVLYGRCDEDLGAPYQPFAEALRSMVPCVGTSRLRGLRGVEALLPLVPGLVDEVPDLAAPTRADPDTERYALFDAVVALLEMASTQAPVVLVLDDLHWAAKPTLLLLRHLLRFGDRARVQIVGTYRSTDLDRSHPLAAMLADLHRDGTANRISLTGLDEDDVSAYVAKAGYDDEELGHALASVTGGNPFFLIEALRHVDESGGVWDPSTLPQGVREAVSRRLTRLPVETNKALAAAAVVGSRFALDLVERVVGDDLVDAFDEASKAGIVIEEPGGRYRFNHAIVRQSLLAELPSMRRMRLHQRIATTLEDEPGADDELLAELAHHYFECAWAGNAAKAVEYCRRAADQAMARLAYEGAADLYDHAVHALDEIDDELPDRDDQIADLLVARCEALLAAGDVASAAGAVSQLQQATVDSARLSAWATCFDGQLSVLVHPERLDDVEAALGAAAHKLAEIDDAAGEAKAHTVRATCLARLGRIGECEVALDDALTAARRAREHRRVNAVLAGAPLAALWGPNPVPRAGGRCLDVVRLLRITTDSPAVEATSTRCQAVLEAFRGRDAAARRMIDSARRTVTELGLRHALLEVEQFAGIVELVLGDPAAAEPHLRQACNGFRRMGLDADTAETAALLGRACLALNRDAEADELCTESERLAGHALKASIAWRTLRAQLLSRSGDHTEARRVAEAAVALAERTDGLVDHGDACLSLARVLSAAGDAAGARAAAERSANLYERKGAAALADRARSMLDQRVEVIDPTPPEAPPVVELDNACVRAIGRVDTAVHRGAWGEVEQLIASNISVENRRRIVGFPREDFASSEYVRQARLYHDIGPVRHRRTIVGIQGDRVALTRLELGTADANPGAPLDAALQLFGLDKDGRIAVEVWFDLDDMDAAIAELDALHARFEDERPPARRLENAANRVIERFLASLAAGDWDSMAEMYAENISTDDRRRVVSAEVLHGREINITNWRVLADIGINDLTSTAIATRGELLALNRIHAPTSQTEVLNLLEVDAEDRIAAVVVFDLEDFDAAIAELEVRYLAGEAADYAHTWSVIAGTYAAVGRHEFPAITPDCVTVDHRRATALGAGQLSASIRAGWDLGQDIRPYVEAVHRLNDLGAVSSYAAHGVSQQGFDAEWQGVNVVTVDDDMVNRAEFFDETDLDAALARFDRLSQPALRLENAASQAYERFHANFVARDWDGIRALLAGDYCGDDRRRVVGDGIRPGRDALIAELVTAADLGATNATSNVVAIRGERLVLTRARYARTDEKLEEFSVDLLQIAEIDAEERITALLAFDPDDFDAAIAELDARYLAGEAAPHSDVWSIVARSYAALNRHELPLTTPDCVNIDHRRETAFGPGDMAEYIHSGLDLAQGITIYVEEVHQLDSRGAAVTYAAHETSHEGFNAEWRGIAFFTVDRDMVNRCEVFDEADVEAALARFVEVRPQPRQLENAASHLYKRVLGYFAARDWDPISDLLADDISTDDRRRVVNAGVRHGRDDHIADMRALAEVGFEKITSTVIATRGSRLTLTRVHTSNRDVEPDEVLGEMLCIITIDADKRIVAAFIFDVDDIDAAFAELDARYLAGEAGAHARTWSLVASGYAGFNRRELPATTPDWLNIDHRRAAAIAPGDLIAYIQAAWEDSPDSKIYIAAVHRLSEIGAVVTHVLQGISLEGLDAEWREVYLLTFEGDLNDRGELFDETDLDVALAKFDELGRLTPRLENAASQAVERYFAHFAARHWAALATVMANEIFTDDRRRVANAGTRRGRDAEIANMRAVAGVGVTHIPSVIIAARGARVVLARAWGGPGDLLIELLFVVEINSDNQITAIVLFDLDDFDSAVAELDARYLAGEAAAHAKTWSVITRANVALNQRKFFATTPDWANIDHRRGTSIAPGEMASLFDAAWNVTSDLSNFIEVVHRLDNFGAVISHVANETSEGGFHAEWRVVSLLTLDGELVNRCEVFDEADLDAALAMFDELSRSAQRLENAASRVDKRFQTCFAARDWDVMATMLSDGFAIEDRRRVVNMGNLQGRDAEIGVHSYAVVGSENVASTVIATRAQRLALNQYRFSGGDERPDAFRIEFLAVVEIDADERMAAVVVFDLDNYDAAIAELDARYLAGEAAAHAHTWSVVAGAYAAFNRHELPDADWVTVDNRRATPFASSTMTASLRAMWDLTPDLNIHIEKVYRLNTFGAVISHTGSGTSPEGFDAEWRAIDILTVEDDRITRCEVFDEADIDAALARFDELQPQAPRLENAADQVSDRFMAHFAAGDWDAMAEILADNLTNEDRRRVVSTGVFDGRDALMANMRAVAELWSANATRTAIATRGRNLVLVRIGFSRGEGVEAFLSDFLVIVEIDADERISANIVFELDDFDAAIAELDARYLAGEAASHSAVWSAVMQSFVALNRHERPLMTPDVVSVDHRRGRAFMPGDLPAFLDATWELMPQASFYIEDVHRLNDIGVVVAYVVHGTTAEGFGAEWRQISVLKLAGDCVSRCEIFDEEYLDAALANFNEFARPARRLENAASIVAERFLAYFAAGDWEAMAKTLTNDYVSDDRRQVVSGGVREGRDAQIADMRAIADVWNRNLTSTVLATRGNRLVLTRTHVADREHVGESFLVETLCVIEIDADERIVRVVSFDANDIDGAIAELDARYLAGEAAAHAHTWSIIAGGNTAANRHEPLPMTPDSSMVDHRLRTTLNANGLNAYVRASWDLTPDLYTLIESVHRLSDVGVVVTHASRGTSQDDFEAEWRQITLFTIEGDLSNRCEIFDETDLDTALARFDELQPHAPRLEHPVQERFLAHFAARDWDAMGQDFADDYYCDDRRPVVNAGVRYGREAAFEDLRVASEIGLMTNIASDIIATRGERLFLGRTKWLGPDLRPEDFHTELLNVIEIDAEEKIAAQVLFGPNDIDAAIKELDERYLAGKAAAHARIWSLISRAFTAINRHELPELTSDWANVDHRRGAAFATGDMTAYIRDLWDDAPDINVYVEAVHCLTDRGAVISQAAHGTSQHGFEAEWRENAIFTFDGDLLSRCELFDERDLDAALARFDELQPQAPRLENAASRTVEQFFASFAVRDWDAMAELLADDVSADDRRSVVNAGIRRGRDLEMANWRATDELWAISVRSTVATRGERLALVRLVFTSKDRGPQAFSVAALAVVEINDSYRISQIVAIDADDIDAAFAELDARYLVGEAAEHAHAWLVIARTTAAFNRHELPAADWVIIDHRPLAPIDASDLPAAIRAIWDVTPDLSTRIEAVHRLGSFGAVVTNTAYGTSPEGFAAEWRVVDLVTVEGDRISRDEFFDETELDAALARFDELHTRAPRLENAATQLGERHLEYFAARNWDAMAELFADNFSVDDRRRVVGAGIRHGRDAQIADMRAIADLDTKYQTPTVLAIRGERLALEHHRLSFRDQGPEGFVTDVIVIGEISADGQIVAAVSFDLDDIDDAFEELDARYVAGEAAAHGHTWSVIAQTYTMFNRRVVPATDVVIIDHRRGTPFAPGDLTAAMRVSGDLTPDLAIYIEAVHRLSKFGAVTSNTTYGTSKEGFEAEWRTIQLLTVAGDRINNLEIFDEADLDAALARFDELQAQAPQLENAASEVEQRFLAYFAARDWDAYAEMLSEDVCMEDRRHVVNAGVRRGRDAEIASQRAVADVGVTHFTSTVIAIRGQRLTLGSYNVFDGWSGSKVLCVSEINAENQIVARVAFDSDDVDAAFAELDARYLVGEAAPNSSTWFVVAQAYVALNRGVVPPTTPECVAVDHRRAIASAVDMIPYVRATWDVVPDIKMHIEAVHGLTTRGAVLTWATHGTSQEGFDAEWRGINILTVEGDLIDRGEIFDEADIDAALARFDELQPQAPRLENTASQVYERFQARFAASDWDAIADMLTADLYSDDRRPVVGGGSRPGRDALIEDLRAVTHVEITNAASDVIATRGERLALARARYSRSHGETDPFHVDFLQLVEIDAEDRLTAFIAFDANDVDAAFKELDARYLAGEAVDHAHTWSVIVRFNDAFNRHEIPATDWVTIDHRRLITADTSDQSALIHEVWNITPDLSIQIEAVHQLSNFGAVVTRELHGTSREGFEAEWRMIQLLTVEGDRISRSELFDEADLGAALARFDELERPPSP